MSFNCGKKMYNETDMGSCVLKFKLSGVGEAMPKMQTTQSNLFISLYGRRRDKYKVHQVALTPQCK